MTSRQALFTFLPFYFFTFKLYVSFQELQCSLYLQSLGVAGMTMLSPPWRVTSLPSLSVI